MILRVPLVLHNHFNTYERGCTYEEPRYTWPDRMTRIAVSRAINPGRKRRRTHVGPGIEQKVALHLDVSHRGAHAGMAYKTETEKDREAKRRRERERESKGVHLLETCSSL